MLWLLIAGQTLSTWCCKVGGSCGVYFWFQVADSEISKHCYGKLNTCWKTQAQYNHQKEDKMSFCSKLPLGACCFTGSLRWSEHFAAMFPGLHMCIQVLMKRACFLANARAWYCLKAEALVEPDHRGSQSRNAFSQPKPRPAWQQWTLTRCHVHRTLPTAGGIAWQAEVAPEDLCLRRGQQRKEHHKKWQAVFLALPTQGYRTEFITVYCCARPWKTRCTIACVTSTASRTEGRLWVSWEFRE